MEQNHAVLLKMGKYTGITSMCAIPSDSANYIPINKRPPVTDQVVIGTPGTIKKWTSARKLSTRDVKILVFDEADHMLAEAGLPNLFLILSRLLVLGVLPSAVVVTKIQCHREIKIFNEQFCNFSPTGQP